MSRIEYDALVLEERRRAPNESERHRAEALLAEHVRPEQLIDPEALRSLRARTELVAQHCPDAGVRAITELDVSEAVADLCSGRTSLEELGAANLRGALLARAGANAARALDQFAPEFVQLPGGRRLHIEYLPGQTPAARSRLQDFFGMRSGPGI